MTLTSDITKATNAFADIKTAIIAKGQTPSGDVSTYATAISNISGGGITPSGTISITSNGTVDVTNYASANVNVQGGGGASPQTAMSVNGQYLTIDKDWLSDVTGKDITSDWVIDVSQNSSQGPNNLVFTVENLGDILDVGYLVPDSNNIPIFKLVANQWSLNGDTPYATIQMQVSGEWGQYQVQLQSVTVHRPANYWVTGSYNSNSF